MKYGGGLDPEAVGDSRSVTVRDQAVLGVGGVDRRLWRTYQQAYPRRKGVVWCLDSAWKWVCVGGGGGGVVLGVHYRLRDIGI